jgi:hypothetical protein
MRLRECHKKGRMPMHRSCGVSRPLAFLLAASLVAACTTSPTAPRDQPGAAAGSMSPSFDAQLAGRLSRALETAVRDAGAPGAQTAVILADGLVWRACAGRSTEEVPMTPDFLTAIGSTTTVYTAALALDLAHDGALSIRGVRCPCHVRRLLRRTADPRSTTTCGLLIAADHNILWFGEELAGEEGFEPSIS